MTSSHPAPTTVLAHHYLALAAGTDQIARAHHYVVDGLVDNNAELARDLAQLTREHNELARDKADADRELDSLDRTLQDAQDKLNHATTALKDIATYLEGNDLELALYLARTTRDHLDPPF